MAIAATQHYLRNTWYVAAWEQEIEGDINSNPGFQKGLKTLLILQGKGGHQKSI